MVFYDQVWSAAAAGDVRVIKEAFQQGLSISFPLRLLGPHSCARDARSNKTPLHLVPKARAPASFPSRSPVSDMVAPATLACDA
jgi:hypothetical protein